MRTLKNMWVQFTSTETVGSSRLCSEKLPLVMILAMYARQVSIKIKT